MSSRYCIYRIYGCTGDESCFQLLDISDSIENANILISNLQEHQITDLIMPVHPTMTVDNNYVYVGMRTDCSTNCSAGYFGGYVIEKN